jgi:hypothetical protein
MFFWKIFWDILPLRNETLLKAFFLCTETTDWTNLVFTSQEFFDLESLWRHNFISNECLSFLTRVIMEARLDALGDHVSPLLFLQSQMLVQLNELKVNKLEFLDFVTKRVFTVVDSRSITSQEYNDIIQSLPKKWFEKIETLEADPENILSNVILYLENVIGNNSNEMEQKLHLLVDYISDLLMQQTNDEVLRDPLVKHSLAFADGSLTNIELYILEQLEYKWKEVGLTVGLPLLLQVFGSSSKSLKQFNKLYHGIEEAIKKTAYPILYLHHSCNTKIPPEQLALISENCIERYLSIAQTKEWSFVHQALRLPEVEESTFIRHCLSHCLVYTLFAHASSRLESLESSLELRIMIGEQIGIWIESLHRDSLKNERYQ